MVISGILDFSLDNANFDMILELYTLADIANINTYGVGMALYQYSYYSSGAVYHFPSGSIPKNSYIYLVIINPGYTNAKADLSIFLNKSVHFVYPTEFRGLRCLGAEAIELYRSGAVYDVVGVMGQSGRYQWWEYWRRWLYRRSGSLPRTPYWTPSEWKRSPAQLTNWVFDYKNTYPFPAMTFILNGMYSLP